jgi:hypothetical protein
MLESFTQFHTSYIISCHPFLAKLLSLMSDMVGRVWLFKRCLNPTSLVCHIFWMLLFIRTIVVLQLRHNLGHTGLKTLLEALDVLVEILTRLTWLYISFDANFCLALLEPTKNCFLQQHQGLNGFKITILLLLFDLNGDLLLT